jgi:hypothetical protein
MKLFGKRENPAPERPMLDINAVLGSMVDRRRDVLYDRVRLRAGDQMPATIRCFLQPVGTPDQFTPSWIKSFADTNMWNSGQLPAPHEMVVSNFLYLFQPWTGEFDRDRFLENYAWQFQIQEKIKARQPALLGAATGTPEAVMDNFGKGTWLNDKGSRADDSESVIHRVGKGIAWDIREFAVFVPSLCYFCLELQGYPFQLQADFDMYVMLDGLRDFAVQ